MENKLEQLFQVENEEWLTTLPKYQQIRIKQLVDSTNSYEEAAKQWLNAMPENTFPLGAEQARNLFIEKVRDEIEKFLSGDEKYADEHQQLVSSSEVLQKTLVSSVSAAIAPVIGTAAAYIMPVVVLVFMTMTKIADQPIVIAGQSSNAVLLSEADLEDDMRWERSFSRSPDVLAKLAAAAMAEYHAGKTQELDPETL
jgi:PHD/YefM family antitoxin component YafN of YafNO toxin-antitoxin module